MGNGWVLKFEMDGVLVEYKCARAVGRGREGKKLDGASTSSVQRTLAPSVVIRGAQHAHKEALIYLVEDR